MMCDKCSAYGKWRLVPPFSVMGIIFYFSHLPGDSLVLPPIFGSDKLLHFMAYAVLAGSVLIALWTAEEKDARRSFILTLIICLLYGISDEFHQSFIPGRYSSTWDVVADFSGALFVVWVWSRVSGKFYPPRES